MADPEPRHSRQRGGGLWGWNPPLNLRKGCRHQDGRCDIFSCRIIHVDQTPLGRSFSALRRLKIITLSTSSTSEHELAGVALKSVHFREDLQLDAGKYDTLLEVVNEAQMVWTCGNSIRKEPWQIPSGRVN